MLNRIMGKGWENFKKWEQGVMNVQTLLFQGLDVTLEGRMTRLMREYGLAIDDLTKAYFDSVSASWTVAESEKLIEQAAILAKAGVTDLAIATNGITSIMNSYRLSITQVDQVAAAFFAAQKYGKITVEGLAKTIGSLAPIAKQVGVSFQEMLAMQAELTKGGLSAHMAANALRSTFLNFIRPAAGAKKALAEIGIETGAVAVRQQGMVNILHKVAAAYEQNADVLAKLTPNVRAMIGLGILNTKAMEELDGMIKVINENYGEGSFLMSAFNNQMNTAAERAKVFKANLRLVGMEFGERFKPTSIALQKILGGLVKLFLDNTDAIFKFFKILGATMASMLAYKSVLILLNSAKVANIAITNAMTAAQAMENSTIKANTVMVRLLIPLKIAYGNVVAVVTGKISLATLAQRAWNAAMAANPIGLVIAGVVALVGVLSALATKTTAVSRAQKELNDIDVEAKKIAVDQIAEVQKLVNVIKDEHSTYQQIEEAKNRLKSINAYYLSDINQETLANGKAKESLEMYIEAIKEKARVELIAAKITEIQKRRIEVEAGQGTDPTFWQNLGNSILACGNSVVKAGADARTSFKNQKDELAALDEEEQIWTAQLQKGNDAINSQITDIQKWETELEDLRKKRQELESDTVKGIQEQIENENDEYEFEKARIEDEVTDESLANEMLEELEEIHNMNMDELNSQLLQAKKKSRDKDSEDSIKKAEDTAKEIAEKSKELIASSAAAEKGIYEKMRYDEQKAYDNLLKEYGLYGVEKEKMTVEQQKVFELLTAQHIDNLISISDKELEGKITRMEEENKAETALRYTQFQQELEALGTNEEAKKKLRQKYQENELKEQQEYLSRLITTLQEALTPSLAATESVAAIVLSEEERKQLEKRINDLKGQLAALGVQINELHPEPEKDILGMTPAKWNELKGHLAGISAGGDTLFSTFEGVTKSINDFMDAKTFTDKASAIANASTALLEGYDAVRTQIENNRLQREEYNAERQTIKIEEEYEKQKLALDSQLRSKQISEEQYNERIEDLDNQLANSKKKIEDDMDKKRKEIALRQARRDKMNAVFSTIINTAVAVVKSWPNLILSAIIAGLGAASLAMIAATPLPKYAKGKPPRQQGEGITSFSNTGKGMVIQGKGQWNSDNFVGLISPNEGIINARSMLSKDVLTLHGTPRQIASQINAYKGYGVRFAYGGAKSVDSSRPDTYIDKEMVRIIVEETIEGITEIPVVVLENDITTSQKRVVQIKSAGNL
jgi:TP901 family phage tail tape measure protein